MQMMVTYGFMRYTYDINMYLKFRKDFISTQTYNIHTKKKEKKDNRITSGFSLNRMKATVPISNNTI